MSPLRFPVLCGLLLLCTLALPLGAQRYFAPQFDSLQRQTLTYAVTDGDTLGMDIYQPSGDTVGHRPLVLYVHGGGFSGGDRGGAATEALAAYLAARGYVFASMSYRLTMRGRSFSCDQPTPNKITTFQAAAQDIRAATRLLLERQEEWRIDPARIVLAGSSAGAEAILHAAYWSAAQAADTVTVLPEGFRYGGLISMAGALVEMRLINDSTALPSLLFHGTCDNLVPYASAPHHYCRPGDPGYVILHGARTIADRHRQLGKPYYLFTVCNGRHEWAGKPMGDYPHLMVDFLYRDIVLGHFRQVEEVVRQGGADCDYHEEDFPVCR